MGKWLVFACVAAQSRLRACVAVSAQSPTCVAVQYSSLVWLPGFFSCCPSPARLARVAAQSSPLCASFLPPFFLFSALSRAFATSPCSLLPSWSFSSLAVGGSLRKRMPHPVALPLAPLVSGPPTRRLRSVLTSAPLLSLLAARPPLPASAAFHLHFFLRPLPFRPALCGLCCQRLLPSLFALRLPPLPSAASACSVSPRLRGRSVQFSACVAVQS